VRRLEEMKECWWGGNAGTGLDLVGRCELKHGERGV
jgi:hypothetical protein